MHPFPHRPADSSQGLSRRRFALAVPLWGSMGLLGAGSALAAPHQPVRSSRAVMGTQVDIIVAEAQQPGRIRMAIEQAFAHMQSLEAQMSRFRPDSVVQRINAQAGKQAVAVSPALMQVLQQAQAVWAASAGAFDPTVGALAAWRFEPNAHAMPSTAQIARALPYIDASKLQLDPNQGTAYLSEPGMALDLGGIAKLPILAAGMQTLQAHGVAHALINGGGDVLTLGQQFERPWQVGVRDPHQPDRLLGAIAVSGVGVVASSGDYERFFEQGGQRYHHVLNPRTGWPTTQVHGVALFAQDVATVNGWGTALMVQGPAAVPTWSQRHSEVAVLVADSQGKTWSNALMQQVLRQV